MVVFICERIADVLYARAFIMLCTVFSDSPYSINAECGVLSVVYFTKVLPQPPIDRRNHAPHFYLSANAERGFRAERL